MSALIEHNDSPLRLYESRWLDPWPDGPMDPGNWGCRLPAGRFYIKKRLTRRRIPGQTLRYQFIASSDNLGDGIQDPPALPEEPDHFASQYGWIFCALGEIMGLEMLLHARQCGIEVLLVSLCVIDRDVNRGQGINLDLDLVFPPGSTVLNTGVFWQLTQDNCRKLIDVKLPKSRFSENYDPRRLLTLYGLPLPTNVLSRAWLLNILEYYVEGLAGEGANRVALIRRCGTDLSWRNYHIDDFTNSITFIRNTYDDTEGDSWYFCIPFA